MNTTLGLNLNKQVGSVTPVITSAYIEPFVSPNPLLWSSNFSHSILLHIKSWPSSVSTNLDSAMFYFHVFNSGSIVSSNDILVYIQLPV